MSVRYAIEKFQDAVRALATAPGDIRERLHLAYLSLGFLKSSDLPDGLRSDYEWIVETLTKFQAESAQEGSVRATLR